SNRSLWNNDTRQRPGRGESHPHVSLDRPVSRCPRGRSREGWTEPSIGVRGDRCCVGGRTEQLLPAERLDARVTAGRGPRGTRLARPEEPGCKVRKSNRPCGGPAGARASGNRQLLRGRSADTATWAGQVGPSPERRAVALRRSAVFPHVPRVDPSGAATGVWLTGIPGRARGNPHDLRHENSRTEPDRARVGFPDGAVHGWWREPDRR